MTDKRTPLDFESIRAQAEGYYIDRIFPAVGINFTKAPHLHQPCPLCGGKDRFRCDDKDGSGSYICSQCGAGNGYTLVRDYTKSDAYEAHALIADILGIDGGKPISNQDRAKWQQARAEKDSANNAAKAKIRREVASIAQDRFAKAVIATNHPYLAKKGVMSHGLHIDDAGHLLIPLYYHNTKTGNITLCNLQTISETNDKRFLKGGLVNECFYTLGTVPVGNGVIFVTEGYATGASIYEAMGHSYPVIVTFNANNMIKCAPIVRALYPAHRIIFCADDDYATAQKMGKNAGIDAGQQASSLAKAEYISPDFGGDERTITGDLTDYNDLHKAFGLAVVNAQISHALNRPMPEQSQLKTSGVTLDALLEQYAVIDDIGKRTNKIYHLSEQKELTKTQFDEVVGDKQLANQWHYHPNKKTITRQQVQANTSKLTAEIYADIFDKYWLIAGTKEIYNREDKIRQPADTLRLEYPLEYDIWLKSDRRQKVKQTNIWFDPSCTKRPINPDDNYINTFDRLPLTPFSSEELHDMMGDNNASDEQIEAFLYGLASPFINLLRHLCGDDGSDEVVNWILNWLAIPLQNTGTKMDTALIFHGHVQGAGKSFFFDRIMRRIYGSYALTLGQGQLVSQYNDWVEGKLWTVFEEIFESKDRFNHMGMIKQLITGDTIWISKKFLNGWMQDNYVNVVFLSNDLQPLSLEQTDRRHVVLYPKQTMPIELKTALSDALMDADDMMVRAFYSYLIVKNVGDQDAYTRAIHTTAKQHLQELSMFNYERFYNDWKDGKLDIPYATCRTEDLFNYYAFLCGNDKEKATSKTRFGTFIGKREEKRVVRYLPENFKGPKTPQATVIIVRYTNTPENPDQRWFGQALGSFQEKVRQIIGKQQQ